MITLLKHCDRVRSASRAQLVNVIAPIMAEKNGPAWRQTVFYPFAEAAQHAHGIAYSPVIDSPNVETESFGLVNALDSVITLGRNESFRSSAYGESRRIRRT